MSGPRLLLTRPRQDSVALAEALAEHGVDTLIEPMMTIRIDADARLDLAGAQAILLTSANGARALAATSPDEEARLLPVLAVGCATAQAARDVGFHSVTAAEGDVDALAALTLARLRPDSGRLVHVAGRVSTGDLAPRLRAAGFDAVRIPLYDAVARERLVCVRRARRWSRKPSPAPRFTLPAPRASLLSSHASRDSTRRRGHSPRSA